jgi:exonuclease VII small subunit
MAKSRNGLTPQEQNLYDHHYWNLHGTGKVVYPSGDVSTAYTSTERGPGGRYYNIPTVWDGQVLSREESKARVGKDWGQWPSYQNPDQAKLRYDVMHGQMESDTAKYRATGGLDSAPGIIKGYKRGGKVKKTGPAKLHKGEKVIAAAVKSSKRGRGMAAYDYAQQKQFDEQLKKGLKDLGGGGLGTSGSLGSYKKGGKVKKTGPAKLHKGEKVIAKAAAKKAPSKSVRGVGAAPMRGKFAKRGR